MTRTDRKDHAHITYGQAVRHDVISPSRSHARTPALSSTAVKVKQLNGRERGVRWFLHASRSSGPGNRAEFVFQFNHFFETNSRLDLSEQFNVVLLGVIDRGAEVTHLDDVMTYGAKVPDTLDSSCCVDASMAELDVIDHGAELLANASNVLLAHTQKPAGPSVSRVQQTQCVHNHTHTTGHSLSHESSV